MTLADFIVFDYLAELGNPFVEWVEINLVVNPRLIHMVENLLHCMSSTLEPVFYHHARKVYGTRLAAGRLTRIEAIWEYVAGHSLVFPMVIKNRESKLNTSASVVSSRLLYVCWSSLTSFSLVTV